MTKHDESDEIKETVISGGPMYADKVKQEIPLTSENRQLFDNFVADHNRRWKRFCDAEARNAEIESVLKAIVADERDDISESDRRRIRDAGEGLIQLKMIRAYRKSGETGAVEGALMDLQKILDRIEVRPFEDDISREIKRKRGSKASKAERAKLGGEIVRAVNELMERSCSQGHKTSVRKACLKLADNKQFGGLNADKIRNKYNHWKK